MIKVQDFARECGVTDRAIHKHLKTYAAELNGLYERRGPNGTWLTEAACDILRGKLRQQPLVMGDADLVARNAELDIEVRRLWAALADAEHRAGTNAEAAGKVALLEAHNASQEAQISSLSEELGKTKVQVQMAQNEAGDALSRLAEVEERLAQVEKERDEAREQNEALKRRGLFARMFRKGE